MKNILITGLLRFFSFLPLPVNHALGGLTGWLCWVLPTKLRKITLLNIEYCLPELNTQQRKALARQSLIEAGKSLTELGPVWYWKTDRLLGCLQNRNLEILQQAQQHNKGIIFLTPHLGCWEIAGLDIATRLSLTSLYRPPRLKALEEISVHARERTGAKLVPTNISGVKSLFSALDKHEAVGILPDQDPGRSGSVFAPFFNHTASTVSLIPRLIHKTGARVILTYAERLPRGRGYILHMHQPSENIYSKDTLTSATAMNEAIEQCIRNNLPQYQWSYKRFKTQPDDAANIYHTGKIS